MAFRSKLEEKVSDLLVELGVKYEYETEKIPYVIEHNYLPDFILPNGVYLECKGYWEPEDRRKVRAVKLQHPELDLRMVFQAPFNTISKKSKTTYAQYCDRLNIPWASYANIPIEWLV
jgi:predicted nuclease of restriction endonuclease-like RecB superfamily